MKLTTVNVPEKLLEELDKLVRQGYYPSRAEAIRIAISNLIHEHREWERYRKSLSEDCVLAAYRQNLPQSGVSFHSISCRRESPAWSASSPCPQVCGDSGC